MMAEALENGVYAGDFSGICTYLENHVQQGDVVLTVGAGDIYKVGRTLTGKA